MKNIIIYVIAIMMLIIQPAFANGRSGNNMQHDPNKTVAATNNQQKPSPSPVATPTDKPTTNK